MLASTADPRPDPRPRGAADALELRRRILIAVAQPVRLGDLITVKDQTGRVEEIGLTYTFIRLADGARLVIPNDTLASDTIRNSTIRSVDTVAEIKVQVPLTQDVAAAVDALREETAEYDGSQVVLSNLEGNATLTVRVPSPRGGASRSSTSCGCACTAGCAPRECSREPAPAPRPARHAGELDRRRRSRRRAKKRHKHKVALFLIAALVLIVIVVPAGASAEQRSCARTSTSRTSGPRRSARTRSSTQRTTRSSARSRPSATGSLFPPTKISKWMPRATVAIEDRRFYEHNGVDVEGIARAAFKNLSEKRVVEGGSTITQQLVRNLYISRERTVERKLKEACLAIKLDRAWSKQRILTSYMNQVYYGNHAYGIEAAARTYFSVPRRALTLKQAALIAGSHRRRRRTTRSCSLNARSHAATRCCARCSRRARSRRASTTSPSPTATSS